MATGQYSLEDISPPKPIGQYSESDIAPVKAAPVAQSAPPQSGSPSQPSSTLDYLTGTAYPKALSAANAVLSASHKYVIDPAANALDTWRQQQATPTIGQSPVVAAAKTFVTGVGADTTKQAIGIIADPMNWPFMLSGVGEVAPVLKAGTNALFVAMQQKGALDAVKAGNYADAAINEGFSLLGLAHLPGEVRSTLLNQVRAQATNVPVASAPTPTKDPGQAFADQVQAPHAPDKPDVVAPKPLAAGDLAPRREGEGTSAVALADQPRTIIPAQELQSQTGEIARLRGVLQSQTALPEEKAYAQKALQASIDLRDQIEQPSTSQEKPSAPPIAPDASVKLTDARRAEISKLAQQAAAAKAQAIVAPERPKGLDSLTADQQDQAAQAVAPLRANQATATTPGDEPLRRMVEEAGGKWNGTDSAGMAHYEAPSDIVGARSAVPIASPVDKMSPDFVQSEFQRKASEFASPQPEQAPNQLSQLAAEARAKQQSLSPYVTASLSDAFNRLTKLKTDHDNATSDEQRTAIQADRDTQVARARDILRMQINNTHPDQLGVLRDNVLNAAKTYQDRADYINDRVKQWNNNIDNQKYVREQLATGGPVRAGIDPETGLSKPFKPTGPARTVRDILHEKMGEVPSSKPSDIIPNPTPKNLTDEQWSAFQDKLRKQITAKRAEIDEGFEIMRDSGGRIEDTDLLEKMKDLAVTENILGRYPEAPTGRRPKVATPAGTGELAKPAPLETMSLADANRIFGKTLRKIPDQSEFTQHASELAEQARLHRAMATAIDSKIGLKPVPRATEKGSVGMALERPLATQEETDPDKMLAVAKANGFNAYKVTDKKMAGMYGLLSHDGKTFIALGSGRDNTHGSLAEALLPQLKSTLHDDALTAMLQNGWIRKVTNNEYEAHILDSKQTNSIEMDQIVHGTHGQSTIVDTKDATGRVRALRLDAGWSTKYDNLSDALDAEKSRLRFPEQGAVKGSEIMGGMAAGMAIGGAVGGYPGMFVGGVLGATSPMLLRSTAIARAVQYTRNMRSTLDIPISAWFKAPPMDGAPVSPEMANILHDQQQSLKAPEAQLSWRQSLIGDMWKKLDPNAFVTDRPNPLQEWTMSQDPRGKGFRDAKGQLKLNESTYVAVRSAISGIRGSVGIARQQVSGIETDARASGLHTDTTQTLNLLGYKRTYEVVREHMAALTQETQQLKQQAAMSSDILEQAKLKDNVQKNMDALREMGDSIKNGKIVPGGYTEQTIQRDLSTIQQRHSPEDNAKIADYSKRYFAIQREALDLIADTNNGGKNSIITKEAYQTYTARGDEYVPMRRILETAADANKKFYGKNSPLYLRQQNVIHQLMGSERTNVDPWQAGADGAAESIREFYRNRTLGTFLDAAKKIPDIAQYFTPVHNDYQPVKGEMVVGKYENGIQTRYAVPQSLGESLDNSSMLQTHSATNIALRYVNSMFKGLTTVGNPAWQLGVALPNIIGRELITGEGPKYSNLFEKMMKDPPAMLSAAKDAVKSTWTHDDKWVEAAKTGLARNSLTTMMYPEDRLNNMQLGAKGPLTNVTKRPLESYRQLSELIPNTIQQYHYNRLRQAGYDPEAATFKTITRGPIPDYAQMGASDGALSSMTTFLRADWAHIRSDLALAADHEYRGKLMLAGLAVAIPTLALISHNLQQKDDKGNSLWAKVSDSDKMKYWVGLTGKSDVDGNPIYHRVSKPDFVRTFFQPMEDAMYKEMDSIMKTHADPRPVTQLIANAASGFIPGHPNFDAQAFTSARSTAAELLGKTAMSVGSQINPAIRVPIEEAFNKTDQFGRFAPIVTNPKVSPELQGLGAKNVSPTMMALGGATGTSPQRLEHISRGILGAGARNMEALTDPFFAKNYPATQGATKPAGPFSGTPINQADINAQQKFYNSIGQVTQALNNYNQLKQIDSVKAEQYHQAHAEEIWKGGLATTMQQRLGALNTMQKKIMANPSSDPQAQQKQLENIREYKQQMMNAFQGLLDRTTQKTSSGYGTGNALSQGTTGR